MGSAGGGARPAPGGGRPPSPPAGVNGAVQLLGQSAVWAGRARPGDGGERGRPISAWSPRSDGPRGPWASELGVLGACPPGPIGAGPRCGASASNARVSQLIVSSRELFFAAPEPQQEEPRPPGAGRAGAGGERRRGLGSRGCRARGSGSSGSCHGAAWGWRLGWVVGGGGEAPHPSPPSTAASPEPCPFLPARPRPASIAPS